MCSSPHMQRYKWERDISYTIFQFNNCWTFHCSQNSTCADKCFGRQQCKHLHVIGRIIRLHVRYGACFICNMDCAGPFVMLPTLQQIFTLSITLLLFVFVSRFLVNFPYFIARDKLTVTSYCGPGLISDYFRVLLNMV